MRAPAAAIALVVALAGTAWSQPGSIEWLILLDDLHLRFIETGRLRRALQAISRGLVRPGDRCVVRCSGPSCAAGQNAALACEAFDNWRGASGNGLREEDQLQARAERRPKELIDRARRALAAANGLLRDASDTAPAVMLYISDGYLAEAAAAEPLSTLADAAAAKSVRVCPVRVKRADFDPGRNPAIAPEQWAALMAETLGSLTSMAERTGGLVVTDPLEGELAKVLALVR
jgi:hypothetical protein